MPALGTPCTFALAPERLHGASCSHAAGLACGGFVSLTQEDALNGWPPALAASTKPAALTPTAKRF